MDFENDFVDVMMACHEGKFYIGRIDLIDWVTYFEQKVEGLQKQFFEQIGKQLTTFQEPTPPDEFRQTIPGILRFDLEEHTIDINCLVDRDKGTFYELNSFFDFLVTYIKVCVDNVYANFPEEIQKSLAEDIDDIIMNFIMTIKDTVTEVTGEEIDWSPK
jgi:hypothetical protein